MKFGLRPLEGGDDFSRTLDQVERAEALGFDSAWFAEHYTDDDQWWPGALVNLAALATRTSEIQLGTNILVAPFYNPVWLASNVAMLDRISGGRVVCGLGVGYDPAEFAAFDVELDDRVGRTIELTEIVTRLWTEESVSFDGKFFSLDEYGIAPKPVQEPRPPVWFGVWGEYLLSQAATRADAWIPGAVADIDSLADKRATYDAHLPDEASPERPLLRDIVVADTEAEARRRAKRRLGPKYAVYASRGHQYFTDYTEAEFGAFAEGRVIRGTPDDCIDEIERYRERLGIDHLILRFNYPGMSADDVQAEMETIAAEILPAFD